MQSGTEGVQNQQGCDAIQRNNQIDHEAQQKRVIAKFKQRTSESLSCIWVSEQIAWSNELRLLTNIKGKYDLRFSGGYDTETFCEMKPVVNAAAIHYNAIKLATKPSR